MKTFNIDIPIWLFAVVLILIIYHLYKLNQRKLRIAQISRDIGDLLVKNGIVHFDFFANERMVKYVSIEKLLNKLERKVEILKNEGKEKDDKA